MTKYITVVPYNPEWAKLFEAEAVKIKQALGDNYIAIHHIGSTAVPGLIAKPKIDILVEVKESKKIIDSLEAIGIQYKGEYNIPLHDLFSKRGEVDINLHVYESEHPEIELNLIFRDYLRNHTEIRDQYAALKQALLQNEDSFKKQNAFFTGYTLGKGVFIRQVLEKAGFKRVRFLKCNEQTEWEAARYFRQTYFFDEAGIQDPYTWTFEHPDHIHFILYQGAVIQGYSHVQLWPNQRAALRMMVIEKGYQKRGLGSQFLKWMERWLVLQGYQSIHIASSPDALPFYSKHDYAPMPFNDPNSYPSDPRDIAIGKILL